MLHGIDGELNETSEQLQGKICRAVLRSTKRNSNPEAVYRIDVSAQHNPAPNYDKEKFLSILYGSATFSKRFDANINIKINKTVPFSISKDHANLLQMSELSNIGTSGGIKYQKCKLEIDTTEIFSARSSQYSSTRCTVG